MDRMMIMQGSASVEASIMTKDWAVRAIQQQFGCPLSDIAVVGDEANDLPMLTLDGLALAAAPSNAGDAVLSALESQVNGYVSPFKVCDGFFDIYELAAAKGVKAVITDRDGVLKQGSRVEWGPEFAEIARHMGAHQPYRDQPYIFVVTASGKSQNDKFRQEYGLDRRLAGNLAVQANPWLLFAEAGGVQVNVLTEEVRSHAGELFPELLTMMKGPFERVVREVVDRALPSFGLEWSDDYDDQDGKVYHVDDKLCAACFNIPRRFSDGKTPYRGSPDALRFSNMVADAMVETAERLSIPYGLF